MIDNGPAVPDAPITRTGGVPLAPAGTQWPACASCGGPMQFLAQILLADAADRTGGPAGPGSGVLALFICQNDPGTCEDWDPDAGGNRALLLPADGLQPLPLPHLDDGADESVLALGTVRTVTTVQEDGADYDRAREAWAARTGNPEALVLGQLGGTPAWIQGDETPTCPGCANPMPLTVQLEEGPHPDNLNFGGGGCAYAFTCRPCAHAVLLWQC